MYKLIKMKFIANNVVLTAQIAFSIGGLVFSALMLWNGKDASVYLPFMTGILSAWMPSPIQQIKQKNQLQQQVAPVPTVTIHQVEQETTMPGPTPTPIINNQ